MSKLRFGISISLDVGLEESLDLLPERGIAAAAAPIQPALTLVGRHLERLSEQPVGLVPAKAGTRGQVLSSW
jgi:hypothetical protein